jgi:hypothetical protein
MDSNAPSRGPIQGRLVEEVFPPRQRVATVEWGLGDTPATSIQV